jgi:hypothetical protein
VAEAAIARTDRAGRSLLGLLSPRRYPGGIEVGVIGMVSRRASEEGRMEMALAEGEVGTGSGSIEYSGVTSCLTVTCLLEDGSTVGGHLSLQRVAGKLDSTEVLPQMASQIGGKKIVSVVLAGQLDRWNPAFLTKPLYADDGTNNYGDAVPGRDSMWSGVQAALGFGYDDVQFDTQDKNDSFTITPQRPPAED